MNQRILVIQTAFLGDVILGTALVENLRSFFPNFSVDFLVRKGNEGVLANNPHVENVLIWNKQQHKTKNLIAIVAQVRSNKYKAILNLHRFASSGIITIFSGAKIKIGFKSNPFAFAFTRSMKHLVGEMHEVDRNAFLAIELLKILNGPNATADFQLKNRPKLFPSAIDYTNVKQYKEQAYVCIAPASVWFTKQLPVAQWAALIQQIPQTIYLIGAENDCYLCEKIISLCPQQKVINLAGKLTLLESAALMVDATMNYVNDSAPMHLASAMNAPTTVFYCSTVPSFGFGPLSDNAHIVQAKEPLACRPCGLHGHQNCPKGHFKCALSINPQPLI